MMMTDWIRQGECNGCGDCCRQATNPIEVHHLESDEAYGRARFGEPVGRHQGLPVFVIRGVIASVCPQLKGDHCGIQHDKPQKCIDYPLTPEDIAGLPRCSYTFQHRTTGELRTGSFDEHGGL